jgi:hypothetical protein
MIMIGQGKRLAEPVAATGRERRATKALVGLLLAACIAAVIVYLNRGSTGSHCVTVAVASYTGGVSIERCGAKAAAWCRDAYATTADDSLARAVRSACRRSGYPPPAAAVP